MGGLFGFGERDSSLFGYAQTLSAGIRHRGRRHGTWELKGGYAFDRFYFIGQDFSDRDTNRLDLDPGAFVAVSVRLGS